MRRPLVEDLRFAPARGERYAVLLARGDALAACEEAVAALKTALAGFDVVFPLPHLTLLGFAHGAELREVQAAVDRWASMTAPLTLALERIATFGQPHQIVYARVRRSAPLERAYVRLRREARLRGLRTVEGEADAGALEQWVPHLSLAYCAYVDGPGWRRAEEAAHSLRIAPAECLVPVVELLTYEERGEEVLGTFPLRVGAGSN